MAVKTDAHDERELRNAFSWLTRIGAGPKFGTRPIGWYQQHQCAALDVLHDAIGAHGTVRLHEGHIQGRAHGMRFWRQLKATNGLLMSPAYLYNAAERRSN